jgi:hypothetical protein
MEYSKNSRMKMETVSNTYGNTNNANKQTNDSKRISN